MRSKTQYGYRKANILTDTREGVCLVFCLLYVVLFAELLRTKTKALMGSTGTPPLSYIPRLHGNFSLNTTVFSIS